MTKVVFCAACADVISPYRLKAAGRGWRWCECTRTGARWADPVTGILEVTSFNGPAGLRVIGMNNDFLSAALEAPPRHPAGWRALHDSAAASIPPRYLFHSSARSCWAVLLRPGDTGDVTFTSYAEVRDGEDPWLTVPPAARG